METPKPMMRMRLSGEEVRRLMRVHHITIRDLAARMDITMKRVREVRERGVAGFGYVRERGVAGFGYVHDWLQGISGVDPLA